MTFCLSHLNHSLYIRGSGEISGSSVIYLINRVKMSIDGFIYHISSLHYLNLSSREYKTLNEGT